MRLSHETPNTTRGLVATMRIDRDCGLDETRQQTRVSLRVKSTQRSALRGACFESGNASPATTLKLATDLARGVLSVLPMRLYNACGLVRRAIGKTENAAVQLRQYTTHESRIIEVAVYLKMTRKKTPKNPGLAAMRASLLPTLDCGLCQ